MKLILASASPRRRELLAAAHIPFRIEVSHAQEKKSGTPEEVVTFNALTKGRDVWEKHRSLP